MQKMMLVPSGIFKAADRPPKEMVAGLFLLSYIIINEMGACKLHPKINMTTIIYICLISK